MLNSYKKRFFFLLSMLSSQCNTINTLLHHTYWPEEARLEKPWLFTFNMNHGYLSTLDKYNNNDKKTQSSFQLKGYDLYVQVYQNFNYGFFINGDYNYQHLTYKNNNPEKIYTNLKKNSLLIGWTYSYKKTHIIDFIDLTIKMGRSASITPLTWTDDTNTIKYVTPLIVGQTSFGIFEWLTIGTNLYWNIPIQRAPLSIEWETYIKADHFSKGFSYGLGYGIFWEKHKQAPDSLAHYFHLMLEYDFTHHNKIFGPRLGFTYNTTVAGKNILKNALTQGTMGFELAFAY